ncbi:MAG TPA: nitroreductase family deazaflavin-dependent oxidoreductase [Polyangiaceae bacterium]|nr:nitroreductase family deazaflavin-dependent oxidoreductase [Polyangiaceae bacterium]
MDATRRPPNLDHPMVPKLMRLYSHAHVWVYQKTGGRLGNKWRIGAAFPRGVPILLLTTIGRKSGQPKTTPLLFLEDGERVVIVGSQGGMAKDPQWFLNLTQNTEVTVQVGTRVRKMRARVANPEERAALWPRLVALYADFATYQAWTDREIPVVILEPMLG